MCVLCACVHVCVCVCVCVGNNCMVKLISTNTYKLNSIAIVVVWTSGVHPNVLVFPLASCVVVWGCDKVC